MKRKVIMVLVGVLAAGMMAACGDGKGDDSPAAAKSVPNRSAVISDSKEGAKAKNKKDIKLLIAAAASLKNAYDEKLIPLFESANPGVVVEGTYDASGKLQTQIEEGLEADIFMSAAPKQMNELNEKGMIETDTMTDVLENKIVLIEPSGSNSGMNTFEGIAEAASIAIGDPESVPVGQYSREALTNLGIWDFIQDRVSLASNVTEVLNQVATGSADAGIVYATDAASMPDKVTVVAEAPEGSVSKAIYPAAVVKRTQHLEEAKAFVEFLKTPEAMAVFEAYGFAGAVSESKNI